MRIKHFLTLRPAKFTRSGTPTSQRICNMTQYCGTWVIHMRITQLTVRNFKRSFCDPKILLGVFTKQNKNTLHDDHVHPSVCDPLSVTKVFDVFL
jgi:hypothetical protein